MGVIVLTNAGQANSYRAAVHRAFLEIVFEGAPQAKENLTKSLERFQRIIADEKPLLVPDPAWLKQHVGKYTNDSLGTIEVRAVGNGAVLDAGEWKSTLERKVDRDGTAKLATTQPPYVGIELTPRTEDGATLLVLDAGQQVYKFTRAK